MGTKRTAWWKVPAIILSVAVVLIGLGDQLLGAYARDEVQWVYMSEVRISYFPAYYIVNGKWPTDLSGVGRYFTSSRHPGRETLVWLNNERPPDLEIVKNTSQRFAGKLNFHSFLTPRYDVDVAAPSKGEKEAQYLGKISDDYLPSFFQKHRKWPTDLSGVKSFYGSQISLQAAAIVKLNDELKPELIAKNATDKEFQGKINFHCTPPVTLVVTSEAY